MKSAAVVVALVVALFLGQSAGVFTREDGINCILRTGAPVPRQSLLRTIRLTAPAGYVDGLTPEKDVHGEWHYVYGEKDGCVDDDEITYAKAAFLTTLQQYLAMLEKNAKIMHNCDYDYEEEIKAGREPCISRADMVASNKTCIATQARLDRLNKYICTPAAAHALGKHS